MSNNKKLVPKRRFKEFKMATQWYNTNFFSVINNVIDFRGRTPKKLGMSWSDDGYLALSALNVKNGFIDFNVDAHYGDTELYQKWMSGNELKKGQVIFTTEAPMGNVTQIPDDKGYILSQRTIAFETNELKMTDNFLAITLSSPNVKISLSTIASGGTAKGVSQNSLNSLKINLPESLTEQTQIGEFFKKLDTLIQTQQKKLEKTKTLKSAYLAEMFPPDGELKPKIRFKEFRENWQLLTLGELKDVRDGTHDSPTYHKQGFPLVTSKNLTDSGLDINEVSLISKTDFEKINKRSKVDRGDILFGMIGTIGNPVLVERDDFAIKNVALIKKGGNILNIFLIQLLKSQIFEKYVNSKNVGNTQKFLALSQIREFNLVTPFIKEQTKIGNFFKLLDKKIALEQRKLEKLNNIKQAYLNEMFV